MERGRDVIRAERREIGAHQDRRSRRAAGEGALHARAKIAAALLDDWVTVRPEPPAMNCAVRRHRDPQMPPPVAPKAAQQSRQHEPLEAQRREVADIPREAPLAAAIDGRSGEQDQMTPGAHQP
jgi:hypothetical protein